MSTNQLRRLRLFVMVLLALLFLQYASGIEVSFANPPSLRASSIFDGNAVNAALNAVGTVAQVHAILGFFVWLVAVVNLVLCLRAAIRSVQVFGALSFVAISLAGIGGTLFVASGFNNDGASRAMAGLFLLSYSFAFLQLYFLRGSRGAEPPIS